MAPGSKSGPALFLGLELATDQLRASIVDESLDLIAVEYVDFDTELSEYQTQGGIFTTPGDAYTTPVDMWVKALDFLLEKLSRNYDVTRIKSIGGCAQNAVVWWKSTPIPSFPALDPRLPLHSQLPPNTFSLANTPVAQDTSAHTHALAVEALLGGPDIMASRVGTCANASILAAQLLRIRESWTSDVWARTGKVQLASTFLASMIVGEWVNMGEAEACATGLWAHSGGQGGPAQGHWDEGVLEIIGGSREEGRRIRGWLGEVDMGSGRKAAHLSRYLCERYGFEPDTIVTPFTSDYLSAYLSLCPSPGDAVLSFGPMDTLLTPAQHYIPTRLYNLFPHPAQDTGEKRRYIAMLTSRNADVPRALVRDMYTKSWSAFDRLVAIVPPGGSIGLDDKLFSFWLLQGDSYPLSHVKGIYRFETGIKVNEFRDLRANPRCLLESQVLSFRVRWSRMISTGVLGSNTTRNRGNVQTPGPSPIAVSAPNTRASSLGLPFDPYDFSPLPARMLVTGAAANFPSVANLVGDVFNAPVFMPSTQVDSAQVVPHRNAPAGGFPSRGSLGGAYFARWIWGKERGSASGGSGAGRGLGGFEEEIRRLHGKRWVASGNTPLRTNVNGPLGGSGGSGANSGTSTPYGHPRSGLGSTVVVEEEEEEMEEMERNGGLLSASVFAGGFADRDLGRDVSRMRTLTGSTVDTTTSAGSSGPSTAFTTPDPGAGGASPGANGGIIASQTTSLTPVVAMPTADSEAQIGLAKVAEADVDAFMTYAAIVPEYCRLESMLCKSLV
ncbi:xylulokinase [Paxillus involutus ATCC 200175]|nr:xylulokinase [Paxillus involutus ATCC 200175]